MSYAERLKDFNDATSATAEHIKAVKDAITNPEFEENPVAKGLDLAQNVLGTTEGLVRLRRELGAEGNLRNTARAIYNRLGNPENLRRGLGDELRSALSDHLNRFGGTNQSAGAAVADGGRPAPRSVRSVNEGSAPAPSNEAGVQSDEVGDAIRNFPQTDDPVAEANDLNRRINAKLRDNLEPDEVTGLNERLPATRPRLADINRLAPGDIKEASQKELLEFKNKIANDAIARKQAGQPQADRYDARGNPESVGSQTASADADGGASAGDASRATTAAPRPATGDGELPNPVQDIGGRSATAANRVTGVAEDAGDLARNVAANTDDGNAIVQAGRALGLVRGAVPTQSGQGVVQGLTTNATSETSSGAAHIVSQAASGNAIDHQTRQAPGSQTQMGDAPDGADSQASQSYANARQRTLDQDAPVNDSSRAAANADEAETGARSGLRSALGVEEGIDELAPETGPLAPILEVGGLLATLGTSIASLFEPQQEKKPAPPKPTPQTLSVGANLKADAQGAVGAF